MEDASTFASATEAIPSRETKLAMKAPLAVASTVPEPPQAMEGNGTTAAVPENEVYQRQRQVWDSVAKTQNKLSSGIDADVASSESATSLQLTLENDKLKELRSTYVEALQEAGKRGDDIIGYAFAVNGKLNSADVYASNALFRKMWSKQLQAAATEAIGERGADIGAPPSPEAVTAFLDEAKSGKAQEKVLSDQTRLETRESPGAVYFATKPAAGDWVHENYLAK